MKSDNVYFYYAKIIWYSDDGSELRDDAVVAAKDFGEAAARVEAQFPRYSIKEVTFTPIDQNNDNSILWVDSDYVDRIMEENQF